MLRAVLLAIAFLSPGLMHAGETPPARAEVAASAQNAAQPCSDHEKSFPSCGISKANKKKANQLYKQAMKLARKKQFDDALNNLKDARAISPLDTVYSSAEKAIQEKVVAENMGRGNKAMQTGDASTALTSFRRAAEVDPTNEYAQQRLRDALPAHTDLGGAASLRAEMGETRLRPTSGVQNVDFRGSSTELLRQFAQGFGITTVPDQGLTPRNIRIKLDNVNWETGSEILGRLCKVLIIPMNEHQVLLANDTEQNRRDLTRMSLRTFYSLGGDAAQDLTDLTTALRILFDLRFITPNPAQGTIVVRAPQATMDAITHFLDYMQDDRPTVMLEVKVFQVSTTLSHDLGTSVPNTFTVFNVTSEVNSLVNSSSYQSIILALQQAGQPVNASTILAALLASSSSTSSSVLGQPFATFGGGLTLSGVTIPSTSLHLSTNKSLARTIDDVLLRAGHGKAATMKVGERYPIVSSQFSATSATSSLLSSLGLGSTASAASVPSPQFSYEDLGLVLKATPQVHGKLVSLEYELTLRALGATDANGLPEITNREMKGSISTDDGESVVIAGLVDKGEIASINGIPLLSMIPVLGKAFSAETNNNTADELLVVMTPHIITGQSDRTGSYVPVPMNVPK
jgi:type II secretory pathway component GspD/PulD (secretin)